MSYFYHQVEVKLQPFQRGCHLITAQVEKELQQELQGVKAGVCHFFLRHTTAAISINECHDANARYDMVVLQDNLVRMSDEDCENSDDLPAQQLCNIVGVSFSVPITNGRLILGTWQGIYLNEFTLSGKERSLILTVTGQKQQ